MTTKRLLFLILFLLQLQYGYTQKLNRELIDSLVIELKNSTVDSAKLNLFIRLMAAHVYFKPIDGFIYQQPAIELAQQLHSEIGLAMINDKMGRLNWRIGNFSEAVKFHRTALEIFTKKGDKKSEAFVLKEIGQDFLDDGKYEEAHASLSNALRISEAMDDKKNIASIYDILGYLYNVQGKTAEEIKTIYQFLKVNEQMDDKDGMAHGNSMLAANFLAIGNYTEALKYFEQGLQASKDANDRLEIAYFEISMGELYLSIGNLTEAAKYNAAALGIATEINDLPTLADAHHALAKICRGEGKYPEAISNYLIALGEYRSIANKQGMATLYSEMGTLYTELNKYDKAKSSFDAALSLYKELNSKITMSEYFSGKAMLDSATGNWKDAYQHFRQFIVVRDSAFNKETLKKLVTSEIQYENEKKETAIKAEQEKRDIEAQSEIKRQRNILNSSFAVLAMVLVFSVVIYRQRNKIAGEKRRSDLLLKDKEILLKEIHHRVKNNLEVVSSLLALQSSQLDDPNSKEVMLEGQNRVHSIGIVHQKLYQGENLGAIEMKDYFLNLSESILDSFGAEKRVSIECAMDQLDVDIDTAVPLGLIVNELLTNTLKYAFPGGQQGKVLIKLEKQTNGILYLEVSDNGVGKSGLTHGTGFGGQLISLLTQQLYGSMREETKNGTSFYFEFKPVKAA